jgi:hypothetical protein
MHSISCLLIDMLVNLFLTTNILHMCLLFGVSNFLNLIYYFLWTKLFLSVFLENNFHWQATSEICQHKSLVSCQIEQQLKTY